MTTRAASERTMVLLVAAVQFVNILDFVMVMPLGPDFAGALGISSSQLGYIGGAYTFAAGFAGLAGSLFLDRFDRRRALGLAMLGLIIGTAAGGCAEQFAQLAPVQALAHALHQPAPLVALMSARLVAGMFGGPATSIAISIVADVIPSERRGRAMGLVMAAFAAASVLGVPAGLELARRGGWRMPFFATAALGVVVVTGVLALMPPMIGHLRAARGRSPLALLDKPLPLLSWSTTALVMMGTFLIVPNISAYIQGNLGYPRSRLGLLYMAGGVFSLASTQVGGRIVDRLGSARTALAGTLLLLLALQLGFVLAPPPIPIVALFMLFMTAMGLRNVSYQTLTSKVPEPGERASFQSIQSAVQHFASSLGAFLSAHLLGAEGPRLIGMPLLAGISSAFALVAITFIFLLEGAVLRRDRRAGDLPSVAAPQQSNS